MRTSILIVVVVFVLSACGGGGSGATAVIPPPIGPVVTPLYDIQGSGSASPFAGQNVTVRGIVTGDFQNGDADSQNEMSGFFLQEENADANPATSDGVFVFDGSTPLVDVSVGDRVTIEGTVNEYFGETQVSAARVEVTLAGAGALAETDVYLPAAATVVNSDGDLIADLESLEGMLVRLPQALTVADLFGLERYGEIRLTQDGRPVHFTNESAPSVAGYAEHQEQIAARSIMLDDGLSSQNANPIRYLNHSYTAPVPYPAIRVGDTTTQLTGNIRFSRGSGSSGTETYRLVPTSNPLWTSVNGRPAGAPNVGGTLSIASFNLLNFFTTIDMGQIICPLSGEPFSRALPSFPMT